MDGKQAKQRKWGKGGRLGGDQGKVGGSGEQPRTFCEGSFSLGCLRTGKQTCAPLLENSK